MSKSHKGNFKNSLKCRLINPTKNEIGDRINKIIVEKVNVNQWRYLVPIDKIFIKTILHAQKSLKINKSIAWDN